MLTLLLWLAVSLVLVTVGAELLVRGAVALAQRLRVSPFFIGLTIVGFGTSTPELFTSLSAAQRGADDLAVGNVVGSNLFNTAFILGVTSLLVPIPVRFAATRPQLLWAVAAALVPFLAWLGDGSLSRLAGAGLVGGLVLYVVLGYRAGRREGAAEAGELQHAVGLGEAATGIGAALGFVAAGLVLLVWGSDLLVDASSELARRLGVSELAIGLTVVAGGTSAPELFTSLMAALRRQPDISVGNILGSNVFNLLGILGLSALLSPQTVNPQVLGFDGPLLLVVTLALLPIAYTGSRVARGEGALLLVAYLVYLWALFAWASAAFGG